MIVSETLAAVLRSGRETFNSQFAQARRQYPALDVVSFSAFLVAVVDPLVRAVAQMRPEQVAEVTMHAYETGLTLAGQRLVGSGARYPEISDGLCRIGVAAPTLFAEAPGVMLASVSNALHTLASTPGGRAAEWIEEMVRLANVATGSAEFLRAGQIVAWRSGLAHYRTGALSVGDTLPEKVALAAIGANNGATWTGVRDRLAADPWHTPGNVASSLRIVGRAGAFRGYGGLFTEPPQVAPYGDDFMVRSAGEYWLLTANAFGATFHRAAEAEWRSVSGQPPVPPSLKIQRGKVTWQNASVDLPLRGEISSAAANATTLALSSTTSHSIWLIALGVAK